MRIASISIGIVSYLDPAYSDSGMRLQHAVDDAKAFDRYCRVASGHAEDSHRLLLDADATLELLTTAVDEVAALGPVDLLLVYLSGHGENTGWFCLQDAAPGRPSLTGLAMRDLLDRIRARDTLLLADCCYAEGFLAGANLAGPLSGSNGRMGIASARWNQQSWEEGSLKRSIFSDVLLRSLSSSTGSEQYVDLEKDVIPALRQQVPMMTAHSKSGATQEPVTIGVLAAPLLLPVVASASLGRPLAVGEVIRKRVSQILLSALVTAIVALLAVDALVQHVAVAPGGQILVRPGLAQIYDLLPIHLAPTIDTGLSLVDVRQGQDDFLAQLATGSIVRLRQDRDGDGLAVWLEAISPSLTTSTRASLEAFARGNPMVLDPDNDGAPLKEANFISALREESMVELSPRFYPLRTMAGDDCTTSPRVDVDFEQGVSGDLSALDARWWSITFPIDESALEGIADFVASTAYRAAISDGSDSSAIEAYAAALITARTRLPSGPDFMARLEERLIGMRRGWCERHANLALALLGRQEASIDAEASLWSAQANDDLRRSQGLAVTAPAAASLLAALSEARPLATSSVATFGWGFLLDPWRLVETTPEMQLLDAIGRNQDLPEMLISKLKAVLRSPAEDFDFGAVRLLACSPSAPEDAKAVVRAWLEDNMTANSALSDLHEGLGCAILYADADPELVSILIDNLTPESRFPVSATTPRGSLVVASTGDNAAVGLGRVAQRIDLDSEVVARLAVVASLRNDLDGRIELLKGLAAQWYPDGSDALYDGYARISAKVGDALARSLETEVLIIELETLNLQARYDSTIELLAMWRMEERPEIRMELARVIGALTLGLAECGEDPPGLPPLTNADCNEATMVDLRS